MYNSKAMYLIKSKAFVLPPKKLHVFNETNVERFYNILLYTHKTIETKENENELMRTFTLRAYTVSIRFSGGEFESKPLLA